MYSIGRLIYMRINLPIEMARMLPNQSTVSKAKSDSISVRTTIPIFIAKQLKLEIGDVLDWKLDKISNQWIVTIEKGE